MSIFEKINELLSSEEGLFKILYVDNDELLDEREVAIELNNPYAFDVSSFLPNNEVFTLDKFLSLTKDLIDNFQEREGIEEDLKIKLVEEYPPDDFADFGDEVICYRLLRREPARMNAKGTGRPHRKSTYYYDYKNPKAPGKVLARRQPGGPAGALARRQRAGSAT